MKSPHQCVIEWTKHEVPFQARCVCGWTSPEVLRADDAGLLATVHCNQKDN